MVNGCWTHSVMSLFVTAVWQIMWRLEHHLANWFFSFFFVFHLVPPRWRIEPFDTAVVKGKNAVIDCDTDAYPEPIISWSKAEGNFLSISFLFVLMILLSNDFVTPLMSFNTNWLFLIIIFLWCIHCTVYIHFCKRT